MVADVPLIFGISECMSLLTYLYFKCKSWYYSVPSVDYTVQSMKYWHPIYKLCSDHSTSITKKIYVVMAVVQLQKLLVICGILVLTIFFLVALGM